MREKEEEWLTFFNKVFKELRKNAFRQYPVEEDGSGSPSTLAIRRAFDKLVCPLTIAEVTVGDNVCKVIKYELSRIGERSLNYIGVVDSVQKERLKQVLVKQFNLDDKWFEKFYEDFRIIAWSDGELNLSQVKCYDIRNNISRFAFELYMDILTLMGKRFFERFSESKNFNKIFNLESDIILPIEKLTKKDRIVEMMPDINIEYLQEQVCHLQLIPSVPKHVKRVLNHSKKLFVFGFFYYDFFTISEHYAYLALESAIRNRYNQSLGNRAIVQSSKGESIELPPSWWRIYQTCRKKRFKFSKIKVNGVEFPFSNRKLLDWLVKERIITKWEKKKYNVAIDLRNALSHLEFAPIHVPNSSILESITGRINKLFSK